MCEVPSALRASASACDAKSGQLPSMHSALTGGDEGGGEGGSPVDGGVGGGGEGGGEGEGGGGEGGGGEGETEATHSLTISLAYDPVAMSHPG